MRQMGSTRVGWAAGWPATGPAACDAGEVRALGAGWRATGSAALDSGKGWPSGAGWPATGPTASGEEMGNPLVDGCPAYEPEGGLEGFVEHRESEGDPRGWTDTTESQEEACVCGVDGPRELVTGTLGPR